jgi:hypothetical protein
MTFRITLIVRTEKGESSIDVAEAIRKLIYKETPHPDLEFSISFVRVENGIMQ